MKKKLVIILLAVIILECIAVSSVLTYILYNRSNSGVSSGSGSNSSEEIKDPESSFTFNIKADVDVLGNMVTVKEVIYLKKPSDNIYLYIPSANIAKTRIKSITGSTGFDYIEDTTLVAEFDSARDNIEIEYEITLENKQDTLSYNNSCTLLTNFLVTPAVYRDNKPVLLYSSAFGDPYIYDTNNYYIKFKVSKQYYVFAPGQTTEAILGQEKIIAFEASNLRDFPAVIFSKANFSIEKHGDINIYYINSDEARGYVKQTIEFAESKIGPYPYENLFVVRVPIAMHKGMEYSNMVFISDDSFKSTDTLQRVTCHEILHQWFYGIIGTDQVNEPFMDEGLVSYLSRKLYVNEVPVKYNGRFLGMKLEDYKDTNEYYELAYDDASFYFSSIQEKMGDDFYKLLQKLYNDKKYSILYFDDFESYVNDFLGRK